MCGSLDVRIDITRQFVNSLGLAGFEVETDWPRTPHTSRGDPQYSSEFRKYIKRTIEFMIARDGNDDGVIEGAQPNTLDASWFGRISWLTSMYLAALAAGEAMATEMDDPEFARNLHSGERRVCVGKNGFPSDHIETIN